MIINNRSYRRCGPPFRTIPDIFAVQDDVAAEILDALQIHVGVVPSRGRPTENTAAYALFLKAKGEMSAWRATSAEVLLLQAVRLDPAFAEAWEMLAYAYWEQWGSYIDSTTATQRVANAASKALAIDPDLDFAQYLLRSATSDGNESAFADAEVLIFNGQIDRNSGFTAHPEYLRVARGASLVNLWEQRGSPDFCEKTSGAWVCK